MPLVDAHQWHKMEPAHQTVQKWYKLGYITCEILYVYFLYNAKSIYFTVQCVMVVVIFVLHLQQIFSKSHIHTCLNIFQLSPHNMGQHWKQGPGHKTRTTRSDFDITMCKLVVCLPHMGSLRKCRFLWHPRCDVFLPRLFYRRDEKHQKRTIKDH